MINVNLLTKILVVLGGVGGTSFLAVREAGKIFNYQKKYVLNMKDFNPAVIEFDSEDSQSASDLTGQWSLLNTKLNSSKVLTGEDGFYEVAVKNESMVNKNYEEEELNKLIKILHCGDNNGKGYRKANWKDWSKEMKCKDVTSEWLYGIALGKTRGLGFFIRRDVFKDFIKGEKQLGEWWWLSDEAENGHIDNEFKREIEKSIQGIESLGDGTMWAGENHKKLCSSLKGNMRSKEGNCIVNGKVIGADRFKSYSRGCEKLGENRSLCGLTIIDVSNYTLEKNGHDQSWNAKLTPEITWKFVR